MTLTLIRPGSTHEVLDRLHFPLRFDGRIAVLDASFRPDRNVREFSSRELGWLRAWEPEALVLPLQLALSLADQKLRGLFRLPSLRVALVVLTQFDDSPLADHHRDLLWQAFAVPVFEQLCSPDGAVIARECEVHDGMHLAESGNQSEHCECGSSAPRLRRKAVAEALTLTT